MKQEFQQIPGYSKAETNGKIVRNSKSKMILSLKKGTKKFQIYNDKGKRCYLSLESINGLVLAKPQPVKEAFPVTGAKKVKNKAKKAKPEPADGKVKKNEQCYSLHLQGKTTEQIMKATGCPRNAVTRNIWLYTSGKKVY